MSVSMLSMQSFARIDGFKTSLLTCSSGEELYTTFGHSALRVQFDDKDVVYDFGIFDFSTPNFLIHFLKGDLDYRLGVRNFDVFMDEYQNDKRAVMEQQLNLSASQNKALVRELVRIYHSDERYYRYNFIYNNCSTRIRDLILELVPDARKMTETEKRTTFRNELHAYLVTKPWTQLGIDILLGSLTDQNISGPERLFLPDPLAYGLENYSVNHTPVLSSPTELFNPELPEPVEIPFYEQPVMIISFGWLLLALIGLRLPGVVKYLTPLILFVLGLVGCVLMLMWWQSAHEATHANWNLLWANPLWMFDSLLTSSRLKKGWIIFQLAAFGLVLTGIVPQYFNPAAISLVIGLMVLNAMRLLRVETSK